MNLKRKFSLIVIAATAIPCLILGFIAYNISKGVITSNITNNLLISIENSMEKIDRLLFERSISVEQWAGNSSLRTALDFRWGLKEAQDVMMAFKKRSGGAVREIAMVDADCMCFASTDAEHTSSQVTWHKSKWWQRSIDGEVFFSDWEVLDKKSVALFPRSYRPIIEDSLEGGQMEAARAVCNFLALLTDMDALRFHALLRGSKASSIFDFI